MEKNQSFEYFCKTNNKLELLKLYNREKNKEKPNEIYYSGTKKYFFKCPSCNMEWTGKMNKMNRLSKGEYNVIKKQKEITYCPYCKGTKISKYYNLTTKYSKILDYWDEEKNKIDPKRLSPHTHEKFYLKCKNIECDYREQTPRMIKDFIRYIDNYKCPKCSNGKNKTVNEWNNLKVRYPEIIKEWDYGRNEKNPEEYLGSSNEKVWWKCRKNHHYQCRINNKIFLNRGCPICFNQYKTSFLEQTIYFYIKKCFFDAENRIIDSKTNKEIDIFIPSKKIAIEVSAKYYHKQKDKKDKEKLLNLAEYYKVYSIQEYDDKINHQLINYIVIPNFIPSKKTYEKFNDIIYNLLRKLDPNSITYPNINIERDTIDILNNYIKNEVEDSFEDKYPVYSKDWNYNKNGNLTPSMFKATNNYFRFNWICSNCGKEYQMTMSNRIRTKKESCPSCSKQGKKANENNSLGNLYPNLISYWHSDFNELSIYDVRAGSEKTAIFITKSKKCVPVKICNITMTLKNNINLDINKYLENVLSRIHNSLN